MKTRPTSDRLRETLFNVLGPRIQGARLLDLYSGSGAVGIEALSRGAAQAVFVESAPPALAAIRENLAALRIATGPSARAIIVPLPVGRALAQLLERPTPFDLVFLDPPYESAAEYEAALDLLGRHPAELLAPDALVIAEHARRKPLPERFGALERTRLLEQSDAALSFYRVAVYADAG